MKLYLYCSYTHSKRGFVLTQLESTGLVPASLFGAQSKGEQMLEQFFSYDIFRVLWQEFSENSSIPLFPGTGGGVFGMRGLKGKISDRDGIINFALVAEKNETKELGELAAGILADPEAFALALSDSLSVGGICGYQADVKRVHALLKVSRKQELPAMVQSLSDTRRKPYSVRDQLRFAVYTGTWEQAAEHMSPQWIWKSCPKQAISQEVFAALLGRDLWR